MAVLRDANISSWGLGVNDYGSANTTFNLTNLTIGDHPNLALVVQIVFSNDPGVTTVTWDQGGSNQACTLIKSQFQTRGAQLWGLVNPVQGQKLLRVVTTNSVTCIIGTTSYYNVDQTGGVTTFHDAVSNTGTSTTVSLTITSATGELTVDCFGSPTGTGSPTQSLLGFLSGGGPEDGGASEGTGASSVTHQWTIASSAWSVVGCSIKEVVPGPVINQQPGSQTVRVGDTATFNVSASGTGTLHYDWEVDTGGGFANATGATDSPSYQTPTLALGDDGAIYRCNVTDDNGTTISASATLHVRALCQASLGDFDPHLRITAWF
jgi:hypothetical protein